MSDPEGAESETIPKGQRVETKIVTLVLADDDIIHQATKAVDEYTVEDAKEHVALTGRVTGGRKLPMFADIRAVQKPLSREVREYYASEEGSRYTAALAMLVDSTLIRMATNFYFRVQRPPYPSRMFTDEASALEWLRQFRREP